MKTYQVTFKQLSFMTYSIEANDPLEAKNKAWDEIFFGVHPEKDVGHWDINSIQEQKE